MHIIRLALVALALTSACARLENATAPDRAASIRAQTKALASSSKRSASEIASLAQTRQRALEKLAVDDPCAALDEVVDDASAFPEAARPFIEHTARMDREPLHQFRDVLDGDDEQTARIVAGAESDEWRAHVDGAWRTLSAPKHACPRVAHDATKLLPGAKDVVVVGGVALAASIPPSTKHAFGSEPNIGASRTAVILLNWSDVALSVSPSDVATRTFTASDGLSAHFSDWSDGATFLDGDVLGPFTTDRASTECVNEDTYTYATIAALQNNVDLTSYDRWIIVAPKSTCDPTATPGYPSVVNLAQGAIFNDPVALHELGHTLGLAHLHTRHSGALPPLSGAVDEYGHPADSLGDPEAHGRYATPALENVGWLNAAGHEAATEVTTSGIYSIAPLGDTTSLSARALKILMQYDAANQVMRYYYVESREAVGFDDWITDTNLTSGALIGYYEVSSSTTFGEFDVPNGFYHVFLNGTLVGGAGNETLIPGKTITDATDGVAIKTLSVSSTATSMQVTITPPSGTCTRAAPTISASAEYGKRGAGETEIYDVVVTDNDASACGPSDFAIAATGLPSGFTTRLVPATALLVPGGTTVLQLAVTSPSSEPAGAVAFNVATSDANDATVTQHVASTAATFDATSCVHGVPSVVVSAGAFGNVGSDNATLPFTATITNNDAGDCAPLTMLSQAHLPDGWTTSGINDVVLAPGASAAQSFTVTASSTAANGTYTFAVFVQQRQGDTLPRVRGMAIAPGTYVVSTCTPGTHTFTVTPSPQSGGPGDVLDYTMTFGDSDSLACPPLGYRVRATRPDATWFVNFVDGTDFTLQGGTTKTATVEIGAPDPIAAGDYATTFTATGTLGNATLSSSATFTVACVEAAPHVELTPTTKAGRVGSTLTYDLFFSDNDNDLCPSASFTPTIALPAGFTSTSTSVTLAPGTDTHENITITAPANATLGDNAFTVDVSEGAGAPIGSVDGIFTVMCNTAAPTISITPSTQTGTAGATLSYAVDVTNNDDAACVPAQFTMTATKPASISAATFDDATPTIAPGTTAHLTLSLTSSATADGGDFVSTVSAAHANATTATATATYSIACVERAPQLSFSGVSTQTTTTGTALSFGVSLADVSSSNCPSDDISLSVTKPSGFTTSVSPSSLPGESPGDVTPITFTAKPGSTVAVGTYAVTLHATGVGGSSTIDATVNVSCTPANPTVSATPTNPTGAIDQPETYVVTIANNDTPGCPAVTYALSTDELAGWTYANDAGNVTLTAGASTTQSITITPTSAVVAGGTFNHVVHVNGTSNGTSESASTTLKYTIDCPRAAPTVSISPSVQTSPQPPSLLTYTATITNNDDATCTSRTFTLGLTLPTTPSAWNGSLASTSKTIAAGASASTTFTMRAPGQTPGGWYTATVTASSSKSASGSGSAFYDLACPHHAPSIALSPSSQSGEAGQAQAYNVTITNHDGTQCAAQDFTFSAASVAGFTSSFSSTTATIAPNATASSTLTLTPDATVSAGAHAIGVTGTALATETGSASTNATYNVSCVHNAPTIALSPSSRTIGIQPTTFTATITNTDQGTGCTAQSIPLATSAPTGWTATLPATVSLNAGASTTQTLTVTPASDATAGDFVVSTAASTNAGTNGATVDVTLACITATPVVTLSPSSQVGGRGVELDYTIAIVNGDNTLCAPRDFTLSSAIPAAFTGGLDDAALTVQPSTTSTTTLRLTAPITILAGDFNATATIASGAFSSTQTATYSVACTRRQPQVTLTPTTVHGQAGGTLDVDVAIVDEDDVTCAGVANAITLTPPSGWTSSVDDPQLITAPGASATTTAHFTSPANTAPSTSTAVVKVNDVASPIVSTNVSLVVDPAPCVHKKPLLAVSPTTATAIPGGAVQLSVTVTNADTSTCAPVDAILYATSALPFAFASDTLSALAPGATASTTITFSPDAATAFADYPAAISVGTTGLAVDVVTEQDVTITVSAPVCVHNAPALSIAPSSFAIDAGASQALDLVLHDNDTAPCSDRDVALAVVDAASLGVSLSSTNATLSAGSDTHITVTVDAPIDAASGAHVATLSSSSAVDATQTIAFTADVVAAVVDAGTANDAGDVVVDAGEVVDSGSQQQDAGEVVDSGSTSTTDAGSSTNDAGVIVETDAGDTGIDAGEATHGPEPKAPGGCGCNSTSDTMSFACFIALMGIVSRRRRS